MVVNVVVVQAVVRGMVMVVIVVVVMVVTRVAMGWYGWQSALLALCSHWQGCDTRHVILLARTPSIIEHSYAYSPK